MKRLIVIVTAVLFSTLTVQAQSGTTGSGQTVSVAGHSQRHRNKHHGHRHQPQHHTGINARR